MKLSFLAFFSLIQLLSFGQLLSLEEEWLSNDGFFHDSVVKKQNIAAIHIWDSEKEDGMHFKAEKSFLHYEFNTNGQLVTSYKAIPLRSTIDTVIHTFKYNQEHRLIKKSEKHGPFLFDYHFFYNENGLTKELKIDAANNKNDTAYLHYFEHKIKDNEIRTTTLNILHKPFLYLDLKYNSNGRLIEKRKSYHRNQSYTKINYHYRNDTLISIIKVGSNKENKDEIKIEYKNNKLNLVSLYSGENLLKKYGFTYSEKGLPKAIIERNLILKKIKIYRIEYAFFSQN